VPLMMAQALSWVVCLELIDEYRYPRTLPLS
jgi:hypothetical protein